MLRQPKPFSLASLMLLVALVASLVALGVAIPAAEQGRCSFLNLLALAAFHGLVLGLLAWRLPVILWPYALVSQLVALGFGGLWLIGSAMAWHGGGPSSVALLPGFLGAVFGISTTVGYIMVSAVKRRISSYGKFILALAPLVLLTFPSGLIAYVGIRELPSMLAVMVRQRIAHLSEMNQLDVSELGSLLQHKDVYTRELAASELAALGPEAKPALPALIKALEDESESVFLSAVDALKSIGPEAKAAIPALAKQATNPDRMSDTRKIARSFLKDLGPEGEATLTELDRTAMPQLIDSLKEQEWEQRALFTAERLGEHSAQFEEASKRMSQRVYAAERLGEIGPDAASAVPALIEALKHSNGLVRTAAAKSLGSIGAEARSAIPSLLAVLKEDSDVHVRCEAAQALGEMGVGARSAIPSLLEAMRGKDSQVRSAAAAALSRLKLGVDTPEALTALIAALQDDQSDVRLHALGLLGGVGPEVKEVVPAIIRASGKALQDDDSHVREQTKNILRDIGQQVGKVNPDWIRALPRSLQEDKEGFLQVAEVLSSMFPEPASAVQALIPALEDDDEFVRHYILGYCFPICPEAKAAIPTLAKLVRGLDRETRGLARSILRDLGPEGEATLARWKEEDRNAIPQLIVSLKYPEPLERALAAERLGELGPDAACAVPPLMESLQDPDARVRSAAVVAVGRVVEARSAMPLLLRALQQDPDGPVRRAAAWALGKIGPEARSAIPLLIAALKDMDQEVRRDAAIALSSQKLEQDTPRVVAAMTESLRDPDNDSVSLAVIARAFGQIGSPAKEAVPELSKLLKSEDHDIRRYAARALGEIKLGAAPALLEALRNPSDPARPHYLDALEQIDPKAAAKVRSNSKP